MNKIIKYLILLLIIPIIILIGFFLFNNKQYDVISILIAILTCLVFFIRFETRKPNSKEIVLIASLTAFAVVSRIAFFAYPGFKPVAAITIIVGISFGKEAGFMVGALSALLSNIYFGHGPWTPFQMFGLGTIGFFAGFITKFMMIMKIKNRKLMNYLLYIFAIIYGCFSGLFYSLFLDIYSILWFDNTFNLKRYLFLVQTSFPFTITYMISNTIFLLVLSYPLFMTFERIKLKYGLYQ